MFVARDRIIESIELKKRFLSSGIEDLESAIELVLSTLIANNKLLVCGNGGSCADAQHFVTELVVRYSKNRIAFPAIALTTDSSILTACANDFSFSKVFSRQVEALGRPNDLLIAISTSGQSSNVIEAVKMARSNNMNIISLIGSKPSILEELSEVCIKVPSENTARIQEIHELCLHIIAEAVETHLGEEAKR